MKSSTIPQIVLTGSSGFLGQHLLHSLIHEPLFPSSSSSSPPEGGGGGLQIHALYGGMEGFEEAVSKTVSNASSASTTTTDTNNDTCATSSGHVNVQVHKLDLTNESDVQDWFQQLDGTNNTKIDVCIHTAALSVPRLCEADPTKAKALNVPKSFLEGVMKQQNSPTMMIALSTDQVYDGTIPEGGSYKETDPVNPVNVYGRTKVELEEFLVQLQKQQGKQQGRNDDDNNASPTSSSSVVILRSSIILGPQAPIVGDKAHKTFLHFCSTRDNQETTFWTDECRSVIAVKNVIEVIRFFLKQHLLHLHQNKSNNKDDVDGIYNMGGLERQSRMDMARAVFQHFQYKQEKLIAAKKADLPPPAAGEVKSPLDITMDSSKLRDLIGKNTNDDDEEVKWMKMEEIVQSTFPSNSVAADVEKREDTTGGDGTIPKKAKTTE